MSGPLEITSDPRPPFTIRRPSFLVSGGTTANRRYKPKTKRTTQWPIARAVQEDEEREAPGRPDLAARSSTPEHETQDVQLPEISTKQQYKTPTAPSGSTCTRPSKWTQLRILPYVCRMVRSVVHTAVSVLYLCVRAICSSFYICLGLCSLSICVFCQVFPL